MGGTQSNHVYAQKHKDDGNDCSPIFRNPNSLNELKESLYEDCKTMRDIMKRSFKLN